MDIVEGVLRIAPVAISKMRISPDRLGIPAAGGEANFPSGLKSIDMTRSAKGVSESPEAMVRSNFQVVEGVSIAGGAARWADSNDLAAANHRDGCHAPPPPGNHFAAWFRVRQLQCGTAPSSPAVAMSEPSADRAIEANRLGLAELLACFVSCVSFAKFHPALRAASAAGRASARPRSPSPAHHGGKLDLIVRRILYAAASFQGRVEVVSHRPSDSFTASLIVRPEFLSS